jgi:ATP/maltotriose-dependent transcriptional regulator MalT
VEHDELQTAIRHAVEFNDDDALASVVEQLRGMRFVEVRRVLDGLNRHQLRRITEQAISSTHY